MVAYSGICPEASISTAGSQFPPLGLRDAHTSPPLHDHATQAMWAVPESSMYGGGENVYVGRGSNRLFDFVAAQQ
jgi:hypothetical protein